MAESNTAVVAWTAIAALVLSLSSAGYAIYRAARGPDLTAFPIEDVMLFGYSDGPAAGELGAAAKFELANTSPDFPDILVSQAVKVMKGNVQVGCLSERGETILTRNDIPAAPAAPATATALPSASPATGASPAGTPPQVAPPPAMTAPAPTPGPPAFVASETIQLKGWTISVLDSPSRAELHAGALLSRRQLFDQRASRSVVDPCYNPDGDIRYTVEQLVSDFQTGELVDLRYEAMFAESGGLMVSCGVEMTDRRAELLKTRGYINAACNTSVAAPMDGNGPLSGVARFFDRIL